MEPRPLAQGIKAPMLREDFRYRKRKSVGSDEQNCWLMLHPPQSEVVRMRLDLLLHRVTGAHPDVGLLWHDGVD